MSEVEAKRAVVLILKDEANELAALFDGKNEAMKQLPHRAKLGIRREMERLREIAEALTT